MPGLVSEAILSDSDWDLTSLSTLFPYAADGNKGHTVNSSARTGTLVFVSLVFVITIILVIIVNIVNPIIVHILPTLRRFLRHPQYF